MAQEKAATRTHTMKALSEIHLTVREGQPGKDGKKGVPPKVDIVPAGSLFHATEAQKAELERLGAARIPNADDKALLEQARRAAQPANVDPATIPVAAPAADAADAGDSDDGDTGSASKSSKRSSGKSTKASEGNDLI